MRISVHGRDARKRIIYALHLEHLGADELPVVATLQRYLSSVATSGRCLCLARPYDQARATIDMGCWTRERKSAKVGWWLLGPP